LLLIRRKWIAESMLWIFIIGIISVNLLAARGRIDSVDYSRMFVSAPGNGIKDKKVMVLGDDLSVYRNNKLGGYFLDWRLSERTLNGVQYYDNVLKIDDMFHSWPPDVIIDEKGMFASLANRIPALNRLYRKQGEEIYLKN
ncbi:MAG TPA: hypothetical protein VF473_02180, partial [Cyclobacteriaceae bacterium]